jgi:hypothetical protein
MKKWMKFTVLTSLLGYGHGLNAQLIPSSLADIRNFETKIDSMERMLMGQMPKDPPRLLTPQRVKSQVTLTDSEFSTLEEKIIVYDRFKLKKRKNIVRHKRQAFRDLQSHQNSDLKLKVRRLNGAILHARIKDQATRTTWVYHSSGYLKVKQPGSLKVWYYKQL